MGAFLSQDVAVYLAGLVCMQPGKITSRERCPACGLVGRYAPAEFKPGVRILRCACGGSWASHPIIEIKHNGKKLRIAHDQDGNRFPAILEQAEAALARIREDLKRKRFRAEFWAAPSGNKFSWQNYLQAYLEHCLRTQSRASWLRKRAHAHHLAWFNGRNVRDIRTADLDDFAALPCLEMALAPSTRRALMRMLVHLLRWAERREDISKAPAAPTIEVPEAEIPWLMPDEQEAVLAHIQPVHRPIFRFLIIYGCRPSEACALFWDAVDRKRGIISFRRTVSAGRVIETTKTRRERLAPIYDEAAELLDGLAPGIGAAPVFRNPGAKNKLGIYFDQELSAIWLRAVAAAGLPAIPLKNGTRHSLGMRLRNMEAWQDDEVSLALGHKSTATTRRFYARPEIALLKSKRDQKKADGHRLATDFKKSNI